MLPKPRTCAVNHRLQDFALTVDPDLSVVAPCFNEEGNLVELLRELHVHLDPLGIEWDVVLVDDGSRDRTAEVARGLAASDSRVRFVQFSRNFGKEAALLAGLEHARGNAVAIIDADLQHPPAMIPEMLERLTEMGEGQVVAKRDRAGDPFARKMLSRAYYRFVNTLIDVRLEDGIGDFRVLSRGVVDAVLRLTEANRFSKGLMTWVGFPVLVVPYKNVGRNAGATSWSFGNLVNYGIDGVLAFNSKPLRLIIYIGGWSVALAVLYVLYLIGSSILYGVESPGYITTIAAVVMFGGLQLVALGIIGEYVGRIYYETKRRPHYVAYGEAQGVRKNEQVVLDKASE
ncbi:MAG: glycosyltransferase family 2 protein [Pseudoclavibacter sp.]